MEWIKKERTWRIRVTPRSNDFQEICTFRSEKITERNGGRWARNPTASSLVSLFYSFFFFLILLLLFPSPSLFISGSRGSRYPRAEFSWKYGRLRVKFLRSRVSDVSRARNAVNPPTWSRGNSALKQCVPRRVHDRNEAKRYRYRLVAVSCLAITRAVSFSLTSQLISGIVYTVSVCRYQNMDTLLNFVQSYSLLKVSKFLFVAS